MKKLHTLYILAILVLTIGILFLLFRNKPTTIQENQNTASEPETVLLRIAPYGGTVQPPPIEEICKRKMDNYLDKAIDFANEVEDEHKMTGCTLVESRVGFSKEECGDIFGIGACSICRVRCE